MMDRCKIRVWLLAAFIAVVVSVSAPADASNMIYLKCTNGGTVVTAGDLLAASVGEELAGLQHPSDLAGHGEYSMVLSYSEVAEGTTAIGGSGGGSSHDHLGISVVRPVAASSPLFMKAVILQGAWTSCELAFYRRGSADFEKYMQITMTTVRVSNFEPHDVAQLTSPGTGKSHLEKITFKPEQIMWQALPVGGSFSYNFATQEVP